MEIDKDTGKPNQPVWAELYLCIQENGEEGEGVEKELAVCDMQLENYSFDVPKATILHF